MILNGDNLSAYITIRIFRDMFLDIDFKIVYFTFSITVG